MTPKEELDMRLLITQYQMLKSLYEMMPDEETKRKFVSRWNEKHAENFREFLDWVEERIL